MAVHGAAWLFMAGHGGAALWRMAVDGGQNGDRDGGRQWQWWWQRRRRWRWSGGGGSRDVVVDAA